MKDVYLITASFVGEIKRDFRGYVKMAAKAGYLRRLRPSRTEKLSGELRYDSHQRSCQR